MSFRVLSAVLLRGCLPVVLRPFPLLLGCFFLFGFLGALREVSFSAPLLAHASSLSPLLPPCAFLLDGLGAVFPLVRILDGIPPVSLFVPVLAPFSVFLVIVSGLFFAFSMVASSSSCGVCSVGPSVDAVDICASMVLGEASPPLSDTVMLATRHASWGVIASPLFFARWGEVCCSWSTFPEFAPPGFLSFHSCLSLLFMLVLTDASTWRVFGATAFRIGFCPIALSRFFCFYFYF